MSFEQFPPVKAPSAYEGDYAPRHMSKKPKDDYGLAIGCGVVAVLVMVLTGIAALALLAVN